jgi:hypothetical protein
MSDFIASRPGKSKSVRKTYAGNITNPVQDTPLQFIPGHVTEVLLYSPWPDISKLPDEWKTPLYNTDRIVNAIKAIKHEGRETLSQNVESLQADIYYPLLRGISDAPTQGDQVLLCKFGDINYYMGPLNTLNSPNFNIDHLFKHDNIEQIAKSKANTELNPKQLYDMNPDFSWQPLIRRLQTPPGNMDFNFPRVSDPDPLTRGVGDLILEGRFGNSIRIGNKAGFPNLIISNGRNIGNSVETLQDGGIISITSVGKLSDNFTHQTFDMASNISILDNNSNDKKRLLEFDSEYDKPQILINSNRLIFNSRQSKLILSAHSNVEIGSGDNIKLYSNNSTIIESKNIYLGESAENKEEPLVLGTQLKEALGKIIDAIGLLFVGGTVGGVSLPVNQSNAPGWVKLDKVIRREIDDILSKHHFIESNGKK